ncbi:hypothetical protein DLAC_01405 [Tieghemostelium lacteum]|uniref:S-adenosyl-L-methionine-dependent methyltransferase n=1 Tax=Tieghemostelium lacteum TaxID=361077 RepID=A0A152A703_TIELA|nr:hypothetical protein DLAC_01405 [Tieghemostelium lacteum]|eukprot:KYR01901.1 hypothetical protein DLAC_01405 [Tieghemostelium lacteum]
MNNIEIIHGVGRTSIFVSSFRLYITNMYLQLVKSKQVEFQNQEEKDYMEFYLKLVGVHNQSDHLNFPKFYDPHAYHFLNTPYAKKILSDTAYSLLLNPEKSEELEKFLNEASLVEAWSAIFGLDNILDIGIRTKFIDDWVLENKHLKQLVIFGSGLDTRALRLPLPSTMTIFEIDLPHVVEYKNNILSNIDVGKISKATRHSIFADLSESQWVSELESRGFNRDYPTLWLMEGIVMYLDPQSNSNLFKNIGLNSAEGSKVNVHTVGTMKMGISLKFEAENPAAKRLGLKTFNWGMLNDEFGSKFDNPSEILTEMGFNKNIKTFNGSEIAKILGCSEIQNLLSEYTIGEK